MAVDPHDTADDEATDDEPDASPPRPGPDALYGPNPTPPQLENGPDWDADPLLVCGCDAYRDGEYLYQDYVYDDRGADTRSWTSGSPADAASLGGVLSQPTGDYHYPTAERPYAHNAADLLEFRVQETDDGVRYRVALNTMLKPDAAAVAIGIDTTPGTGTEHKRTDWGYGLGDLGAPAEHTLVTWGTGAELDGEPLDDDAYNVDVRRNQIDIEVPLSPDGETWRHFIAVGLWDDNVEAFRQVEPTPDEETPGGIREGQDLPPVFNVGFRFNEPYNRNLGPLDVGRGLFDLLDVSGVGHTVLNRFFDQPPRVLGEGNWREHRQAMALADRDISEFYADIDFGALRDGQTTDTIPESGFRTQLYPSRYYLGEGIDTDHDVLEGRIQPYNVYVPESLTEPAPLILLLHSLSCSYTQYAVYTPGLVRQISEATGGIVLMPQARGPGQWYKREAELDIFEAWRDLETRFDIDRSRVVIGGYSMGGFGTCMLAAQCPDLFGRGFSVVGPPTEDPIEGITDGQFKSPTGLTEGILGGEGGGSFLNLFTEAPESAMEISTNLRHIPMLLWNAVGDPLVPFLSAENYARRLRRHRYRHEYCLFPAETHLTLGIKDQWDGIPEFVSRGKVIRNPRRVTYKQVPALDHPEVGLVHDSAYWVSDISTRESEETGLIDAISLADGYAPPEVGSDRQFDHKPGPHVSRGVQWETPPVESRRSPENAIEVTLEGAEAATLWIEEAGIDVCEPLTLRIESDGPATITLAGTFGTYDVAVEKGETTVSLSPQADLGVEAGSC